jgi:nitrate/nitrite-specific signal transduction histidine kinase
MPPVSTLEQASQKSQRSPWLRVTTAVAASYKSAYNDLEQQMGSTSADLSSTERQLEAQAEAKAAKEQAKVTTECSQALLTSVGAVFQADDPKAEGEKQKKQLEAIAADCRKALGGS